MSPIWCHHLELPIGSSFAEGAAVLMATLADQTSLPWPDEFPRKIERANKADERRVRPPDWNGACGDIEMAKDAFERRWEWAEKPADSTLTVSAHVHDAVMELPPEQRRDRAAVNEAVRLADPDAQR
jgi:hypothetical protein